MAYPFLIRFSRGEELRYLGHLDMMRLFERALRRAGLPLTYTQGYNPRIRFSLAVPLSVGMTSAAEYLELVLDTILKPLDLKSRLQHVLPSGIDLMEVRLSQYKDPLGALAALLDYTVTLSKPSMDTAALQNAIDAFLKNTVVSFQKTNKSGTREINIRPLVHTLALVTATADQATVQMKLVTSPQGSIKPEEVIKTLGIQYSSLAIHRSGLFFKTQQGDYYTP